jgi:biotin-(acetyl-CoA carboxylase) ligase
MNTLKTMLAAAIVGISLNVAAASPEYMADMKKVDTALKMRTYSPSTTDEARRLRGDMDRMMKENREAEAMKVLEQVKALLDVK